MERLVIEQKLFRNPSIVSSVLDITTHLDRVLPVDPAHNLENHGIPVAKNTIKLAQKYGNPQTDFDSLTMSALLHDRARFVFGHLPAGPINNAILKKAGCEVYQIQKVAFLIGNHSNLRPNAPFEEQILYLADKREYFSIVRMERTIDLYSKFALEIYKKHFNKRVPRILENVTMLDGEGFAGIKADFFDEASYLKLHIEQKRPELLDLFKGINI